MNVKRARILQDGSPIKNDGDILYWMSRDMRVWDNWALIHASNLAMEQKKKFVVGFYCYDKKKYSKRIYDFFEKGLDVVKKDLKNLNIEFRKLNDDNLKDYSEIVFDFSPLHGHRKRLDNVKKKFSGKIWEVDARNIVPCWVASPKLEFGAYTLRPKIQKLLPEFLDEYPDKWKDKNKYIQSGLSALLHFGHISAQRVAMESKNEDFLEQLIVRRELADNYCYYCKDYDNFNGFWDWAKKTLDEHRKDKREFVYTKIQFEEAKTHDQFWNACQMQMVKTGKMDGYMRMYWAKKILEWTDSPEVAQEIAIYLNDKYELDGRDSNGYTGIAWSIGGVHDRAWGERNVFGKIRYMNLNGCKRKFNVVEYIEKWH